MEALIFYAFLAVLVTGYVIDGHRKQTRMQPEDRDEERYDWRYFAIALPCIVGLIALFELFINPWIDRHVPGPNAAWVVSFVVIMALFMAVPALARRATRQS